MAVDRQRMVAAFRRAELRMPETTLAPRSLIVEPLAASETMFAAVDSDGFWALVIRARKSGRPVPSLMLSMLAAEYGTRYALHRDADVETLRVCVVRCLSLEPAVRSLFATFCGALINQMSTDPNDSEIEHQVGQWVALFWRLQTPARTTVTGLIGELTLIDSVKHVGDWVRAWHIDASDNLDFAFSTPPLSVEVKATLTQQRVHELSLHQAMPTVPHQHYFASVIVELRQAGVRIGDVVDEIVGKLGGTLEVEFFWRSLASVCGSSLGEFFDVRYMREVARTSLQFYSSGVIPRPVVQSPIPPGVSGIRFRSDFSSVAPTDPAQIIGFAEARTAGQ